MLVASGAIILAQLGVVLISVGSFGHDAVLRPVFQVLSGLIAPVLFAYAILRHRVFDLGFAINRTLVYGLVSAILLVAFGVLEWAFDHFVPIQGRRTNAAFDAVIAVGVSLTFNWVLKAVEHVIESLFFRAWRERDAALRRFVREARFVLRPKALTQGFVAALERFSNGAGAAIYLADQRGDFIRSAGDASLAPNRIDADAPTIVTLRADGAAEDLEHMEPAFRPPWRAAMAVPMLNRSALTGFVLMGPKPLSVGYRPDEIEVLTYAVHQVGLDLHGLKMEAMQRKFAGLSGSSRDEAKRKQVRAEPS
jgi:hypothetical protein